MGIGRAKGENRIIEAVRQAVSSPLLETTIEGAKSVILNVTGGKDLMLTEANEAAVLVQGIIDSSANIIFGATIDDSMSDEVKITVIATGFTSGTEGEIKLDAPDMVEVKPAINFRKETTPDASVPPLIRDIEEKERQAMAAQNVEAQPEKTIEKAPELEKIEEELNAEPEDKKGRELPAFMRRLFKK